MSKKRTTVLVVNTIGFILIGGGFVGGVAYAMFQTLLALGIGAAIGTGFGLIVGLDGES